MSVFSLKQFRRREFNVTQWHEYSYLAETCGNTHCKYFTVNGCIHPYVKDCENASLYWPWQLDYDNMEILIKKRNKINDKNN